MLAMMPLRINCLMIAMESTRSISASCRTLTERGISITCARGAAASGEVFSATGWGVFSGLMALGTVHLLEEFFTRFHKPGAVLAGYLAFQGVFQMPALQRLF